MKSRGPLAAFFAFGAFWGAWGVLIPEIKELSGASLTELGIALLFSGAAALPTMLLTGRLVDRFGTGPIVPILILFAAAALLPAFARSVWQLILALTVVGAASGAVDVAINVAATALERSGGVRLMQKAHALFSAGFLAAAVGVGLGRQAGADPLPVLAGCSLLALAAATLNRGVPLTRLPAPARRAALSWPLVAVGALCAVAFIVEGGIEAWSALFLETRLDASPALSGLGPGFFAAAMVLGRSMGQTLETRIGDRALLAGGAAVAAVGLAAAASAPAIPVALAGFFLGGAGISVAAPILFGAAGRCASDTDRGSAVATVTTVAYLGFLLGPPLIGAVSGSAGLRVGIGTLALIAGLLALVTAFLVGDAVPLRRLQHPPRRELS